jgi:hypothetical protein
VPPRRRLQVRASTAARASAKVCACLRPGPEGWRRGRQRAPLRAAPSRAELLIAARDDRLGRVLGDASLPRIWAASESGTVSMPSRMRSSPSGCPSAWSSARVSACFVRGVTPRQPLRVCLSASGPNFSSRRSRTASKSIPSVASASGSILGRPGGDTRAERLLDGIRADAELPQDRRGASVPVADQHQQQVLRADVGVPEPAGLTLRSSW